MKGKALGRRLGNVVEQFPEKRSAQRKMLKKHVCKGRGDGRAGEKVEQEISTILVLCLTINILLMQVVSSTKKKRTCTT